MVNAELLNRGLGAQRRGALVWAIALVGLTASVLAVWPAMSESDSLDSLASGMSPELVSALGLEALSSPRDSSTATFMRSSFRCSSRCSASCT